LLLSLADATCRETKQRITGRRTQENSFRQFWGRSCGRRNQSRFLGASSAEADRLFQLFPWSHAGSALPDIVASRTKTRFWRAGAGCDAHSVCELLSLSIWHYA